MQGKAAASGLDLVWRPAAGGPVLQPGEAARPSVADSVNELPTSPAGVLQRLRSFKFRKGLSKGDADALHEAPGSSTEDWSIQASRTPIHLPLLPPETTSGDDGLDVAATPESPSTPLSKLRQLKLRQQQAAERRLESAGSVGTPPRTSAALTSGPSLSTGGQPGSQILAISHAAGAWISSPTAGGTAETRFKVTSAPFRRQPGVQPKPPPRPRPCLLRAKRITLGKAWRRPSRISSRLGFD